MNAQLSSNLVSTDDTNINSMKKLITPNELINWLSLSPETAKKIELWRQITQDIIYKKDDRILTIVWPCSIHSPDEAIDYAEKLKELEEKYPNLHIVMRTYFEKPRTTVGWKWLINDPNLDWSFDIENGLKQARKLLLEISEIWLPVSTEFLDPISPEYISDLITWWAIWARTTESQTHRELVSWLSPTIWFKNSTSGDIQIAIDAMKASVEPHNFLWIINDWTIDTISTSGNKYTHLILRGWSNWPNYHSDKVNDAINQLKESWIKTWVMIDASHANSNKDYRNQSIVIKNIAEQIESWNKDIIWVMIESNIKEWSQSFNIWKDKKNELEYWVSITDSCISIQSTDEALKILNNAVLVRKNK